ncbi:MAG: hypothetical protein IJ225_00520 [Solobacterium sp.]|nr:hypothetical protein [Solobacterium sp.]
MKRQILKKWNQAGMSLAETLFAVALMGIVLVAVTTGVSTILNVYNNIVMKADALTLLSTVNTLITADLESADAGNLPTSEGGNCWQFESGKRGYSMAYLYQGCSVDVEGLSDDDRAMNIYYYVPKGINTTFLPIVSDATLTKRLGIRMTSFEVKNNCFEYKIEVFDSNKTDRVIKAQHFVVKPQGGA